MKSSNFGPYNVTDMLLELEEELQSEVNVLRMARQRINMITEECEELSLRIIELECELEKYKESNN